MLKRRRPHARKESPLVRLLAIATVLLAVLALAACSSADKGGGKVSVTLAEWALKTDVSSLPHGDIEFNIKNDGPDLKHELKIIRTDFAPDKLPAQDDGSVNEDAAGIEVLKKVQEIETGDSDSRTFTLAAGKYVLICNLVTEQSGQKTSHYKQGMRIAFTVTP